MSFVPYVLFGVACGVMGFGHAEIWRYVVAGVIISVGLVVYDETDRP